MLSVTVLLGGALCSAVGCIHVLLSSPRLPHVWLLHHDGMGSDGDGRQQCKAQADTCRFARQIIQISFCSCVDKS